MYKIFVLFSLSFFILQAQDTSWSIDKTHTLISTKVMSWSKQLDRNISTWIDAHSSNKLNTKSTLSQEQSVDDFFKNKKYFNELPRNFMGLRTNIDTADMGKSKTKVGGQFPFFHTKKRLNIFLETMPKAKEGLKDSSVGISYILEKKYGILARYSLAMQGSKPFAKASYYMNLNINRWDISPSQHFKYSIDTKFEEESIVYFDKVLADSSLFRIYVQRKNEAQKKGMDYALGLQYYWKPIEKIGLSVSQSFLGNTAYSELESKPISTFITAFSLRQNIGRPWFFYELRPSINFQREDNYKANYRFHILFDLYFGKF